MTVTQPSSFGSQLRALREAAGLSQEELAERAHLSSHAVSALERGTRTRPYPHTVRALADALSVTDDQRASLVAAVPARRPSNRGPADPPARTGRGRSRSRPHRCVDATATSTGSFSSFATHNSGWSR